MAEKPKDMDKILETLRRLKALSDSPNVHEAASAAAMVQKLLFKYNLEEYEIPSGEKEEYSTEIYTVGAGKSLSWKRLLLFPVAKYNFCRAYYLHDVGPRGELHRTNRMKILGEPSNIKIVEYLFEFLSSEIERLAEEFYYHEGNGHKTSWKSSFCNAAVIGIGEKLREQFLADRQAEVNTQALVLVKDQAIEDAEGRLMGKVRLMSLGGQMRNQDAARIGYREGKNINIRPGIEEENEPISAYLN